MCPTSQGNFPSFAIVAISLFSTVSFGDLILLFTVHHPFNVRTKQPINFPTISNLFLPPLEFYISNHTWHLTRYIRHANYIISLQTHCSSSSLRNKNSILQQSRDRKRARILILRVPVFPSPPSLLPFQHTKRNLTGDVKDDHRRESIDIATNERAWRRIGLAVVWKKRKKKSEVRLLLTETEGLPMAGASRRVSPLG